MFQNYYFKFIWTIIRNNFLRLDDELREVKKIGMKFLKLNALQKDNPSTSLPSPPRHGYRPPSQNPGPLRCPLTLDDELEGFSQQCT